MEFTKVLLHKNQHLIDNELNYFITPKAYFQSYVNKVIALGFTVATNDLIELFENPKAYITEKITQGENLQVGNLTLNKEKLFDLIEKPDGTTELINEIISDQQNQDIRESNIWKVKYFSVVDNLVTINQTHLDFLELKYSLFIETENQQNGFNKMTELVNLINQINQLAKHKIGGSTEISEIMRYTENGYEVSFDSIKRF